MASALALADVFALPQRRPKFRSGRAFAYLLPAPFLVSTSALIFGARHGFGSRAIFRLGALKFFLADALDVLVICQTLTARETKLANNGNC
jgi:hypothetical protein